MGEQLCLNSCGWIVRVVVEQLWLNSCGWTVRVVGEQLWMDCKSCV